MAVFSKEYHRVCRFLKQNGWAYDKDAKSFLKENACAVQVDTNEIYLLDDSGDFLCQMLSLPLLIGNLMLSGNMRRPIVDGLKYNGIM